MKKLVFETEQDFLSALDGKVYAISNLTGEYICDVLEEVYVKLLDEGICANLDDGTQKDFGHGCFSQYVLLGRLSPFEKMVFKELWGVEIIIKES